MDNIISIGQRVMIGMNRGTNKYFGQLGTVTSVSSMFACVLLDDTDLCIRVATKALREPCPAKTTA
jgi:hypothetical protein